MERFFKREMFGDIRLRVAVVILLTLAVVVFWYLVTAGVQSTNNAIVQCDVIDVTPEVRGVVKAILFEDDEVVEKDSVLLEIEDADYVARFNRAKAELSIAELALNSARENLSLVELNTRSEFEQSLDNLTATQARLLSIENQIEESMSSVEVAKGNRDNSRSTLDRITRLYASKQVSQSDYDDASLAYTSSEAALNGAKSKVMSLESDRASMLSQIEGVRKQTELYRKSEGNIVNQARVESQIESSRVDVARAQKKLAELNLKRTRISALRSGFVSDRNVGVGQLVEVGQPVARIVSCSEEAWVEANFKETQVGGITPGQRAEFTIDAYPDVSFEGVVESISGGSGSTFSLLPPENATGNFTKVVKRIPVKIKIENTPKAIMRVGMSAVVSVHVH